MISIDVNPMPVTYDSEFIKRRIKEVSLNAQISQEIAQAVKPKQLFKRVVNLIKENFNYYHVQVYTLVDNDLVLQEGTGEAGEYMKHQGYLIPLKAKQSIVAYAGRSKTSVLVSDVTKEQKWLPHISLPSTKSEVAIPIIFAGELLGVLDVQDDILGGIGPEDEVLLRSLCDQIAVAIDYQKKKLTIENEKNKFKALAELSAVGIVLMVNEHIAYVNPSFAKLTGLDQDSLTCEMFLGMIDPEHREYIRGACSPNFAKENKDVPHEVRVINANNEEKWLEMSVRNVAQDSYDQILITFVDITARKSTEQELLQAKQLAEKSVKQREQFLANVSHEIRTPLNAITGMSELLSKTDLSSAQRDYVEGINYSGGYLLDIMNELLDFSKINARKEIVRKSVFDVRLIISKLVSSMSFKAVNKGILVGIYIDPSLPEKLVGDGLKLSQVLTNLLDNALKFTTKGNIFISVNVLELNNSCKVQFKVSDSGIGISPENQELIFDSFSQIQMSDTKTAPYGTGLGLSIVKNLIKMQNGTISLKSELGKGSTFTFALEYDLISSQINKPTHKQDNKNNKLFGKRVLLVEDNKLNQLVARRFLEEKQIVVETATDGEQALDRLEKYSYDLILLDLEIPIIDGFQVANKIRTEFVGDKQNIPIVALTAHAYQEIKDKAVAAGVNTYLAKPFSSEKLIKTISKYIA